MAIQTLISLVLLVAIYASFKFRIDLWWLNFWYSLPLIGKIATLSKDSSRYAKDKSWTNSERTLCNDYKQFVHLASEAEFNKRIDYMAKANDTGRVPTPGWLFLVLGILIMAEGMGFSYLLGTWMASEGSEDTRKLLMGGIVLVLCVVLGFLTHTAGHQMFRTNLIRRCQKEWRDEGQDAKLLTAHVTLKDDQTMDDKQPHYTQCINRVGSDGSYVLVGIAVAAIVVIAVASTVMRVKHLESEQGKETIQAMSTQGAASEGNPFARASELPSAITAPQAAADAKAKADIQKSSTAEGISAFLMLAFIFIVTQIVGIIAGYKWGFAGKNSKDAYKSTLGFSTFDDYTRYFSPILTMAEAKLSTLQQCLAERNSNIGLGLKNTFGDFLLDRHVSHVEHVQATKATQSTMPSASPVAQPAATTQPQSVADVIAVVEGFGADKEGAKRYLLGLSDDLRAAVTPVLKARKEARLREEEEQRQAQRSAALGQELDDIL
ncbi:MAG: hypothetical protein V4508_08710 [Pseudomonadota bacterium]